LREYKPAVGIDTRITKELPSIRGRNTFLETYKPSPAGKVGVTVGVRVTVGV
jgi:hypothetical protein